MKSTNASVACVAVAVLFLGGTTKAEISLQLSEPLTLSGGLVQYRISAVGTEGEQINVISFLDLSGTLHQVNSIVGFGRGVTPETDRWIPGLDDGSRPFDTHFLLGGDAVIEVSGARLIEPYHDGSTSDLPLGIPQVFSIRPPSGFADRLFTENGAYKLSPEAAGENVEFLQVVLRDGQSARLDVRVDAPGVSSTFTDFLIGVPEPSSSLIVALAMVGVIRRRTR